MSTELPTQAQTLIIGGGSIGCNTAYQLTKLGMKDVVVLEQGQLTSGTTWHAAGLIVAGLLKSESECEIYTLGRDLYANLEKETGISTGFRDVGYLQIASNQERVHEMRRHAPFMRRHGINMHEISTQEAQDLFPIGDLSDVLSAFYIPEDGRANPVDVTMSLAKGARMGGAQFFEGVMVLVVEVNSFLYIQHLENLVDWLVPAFIDQLLHEIVIGNPEFSETAKAGPRIHKEIHQTQC